MALLEDLEKLSLTATTENDGLTLAFTSVDSELVDKYLRPLTFGQKEAGERQDPWRLKVVDTEAPSTDRIVRNFLTPKNGALIETLPHIYSDWSAGGWDGNLFGGGVIPTTHQAFTRHMPLRFKPDDFHFTIMQGLSLLIQQAPEAFRQRLGIKSGNGGKEEITVAPGKKDPAVIAQNIHELIGDELVQKGKFLDASIDFNNT
jgi:hypothetical protein